MQRGIVEDEARRVVLAQRPVVRKGIGVKIRRQRLQVEAGGDLARTQPQSTTLNSTLRSSASFASSLPMPIKFSCEPTPIALVRVFSAAASASRRCLTYCARCSEMRSLTGSEPLALVWPTMSRQAEVFAVCEAI